jgi:flagellar FliL protein
MAETKEAEADGAAGGGAAPKKGGKKLIIIIAAALVLLLAGGGAAAYFMGMFGVQLPDLLVNLSSSGRRSNFIKLKITLELEKALDEPRVKTMQPRIIDNFQTYLRDLRLEDLQGAQGLFRLREELLIRINAAVAPAKVTDILFQEMLVQ